MNKEDLKEKNEKTKSTKEVKSEKEKSNNDIKDDKKSKKKKELNINSQEYIDEKIRKKKKRIKIAIISVIVIVLLLILCTVFAIITMLNNKIVANVTINSVDVSGLTSQEAKEKLKKELSNGLSQTLKFHNKDYEAEFTTEDLEVTYKIDETVEKAYNIGRNNNLIFNNFNVIKKFFVDENLQIDTTYNVEKLDSIVTELENNIPDKVVDYTYCIEEDELIITKGTPGNKLNKEKTKDIIIDTITNITPKKDKISNIDLPVDYVEPGDIDIEKIYEEVHTEPKDAYIEKDPFKLVVDEDGIDFAISMEEAKALLKEDKDEYIIPLKIQKANKTVNDLGEDAFPHQLSNFTTKYDASNTNRTTNLRLASNKINGTVVLPGDTFSYNKVVGKRTIENGYKEAAIYENGQVVDGVGGGICQISSTLYNAVVIANLGIVQRSNHMFTTTYADPSRDATVVYGSVDFQFKNTRKYPIKLVSSVNSGIASISVYGIKEDVEYTVKISSAKTGTIPFAVETIEDPTLEEGKQVVKQPGKLGCRSVAYKELYLNGNFVSKTLLSTDTYSSMKQIVLVGTKKVAAPASPAAPETPAAPANPSTPSAPTNPVTPENPTTPDPSPEPTPSTPDQETTE